MARRTCLLGVVLAASMVLPGTAAAQGGGCIGSARVDPGSPPAILLDTVPAFRDKGWSALSIPGSDWRVRTAAESVWLKRLRLWGSAASAGIWLAPIVSCFGDAPQDCVLATRGDHTLLAACASPAVIAAGGASARRALSPGRTLVLGLGPPDARSAVIDAQPVALRRGVLAVVIPGPVSSVRYSTEEVRASEAAPLALVDEAAGRTSAAAVAQRLEVSGAAILGRITTRRRARTVLAYAPGFALRALEIAADLGVGRPRPLHGGETTLGRVAGVVAFLGRDLAERFPA